MSIRNYILFVLIVVVYQFSFGQQEGQQWEIVPINKSGHITSMPDYEKQTVVLLNGTVSVAPQFSIGISVGQVKKFGWYASLMSNGSFGKEFVGECDENGFVGEDYPLYSGEKEKKRFSITLGSIYRWKENSMIYAGVGYGNRMVFLKVEDDTYIKSSSMSYNGLSIEAGLIQQLGKMMFSGGLTSIGLKYAEFKFGVGMAF